MPRRVLAEREDIAPCYLANIELEQTIPSLPVIIQLVKICGLPMERYFKPEVMLEESELRQQVGQKLKLCSEQYLPIVDGAIDGALKIEKPNEENLIQGGVLIGTFNLKHLLISASVSFIASLLQNGYKNAIDFLILRRVGIGKGR